MSGEMVPASVAVTEYFTPEQTSLIKSQIAKGCTDDELKLFLYQCARTQLDPFSRQIYAIVRNAWNPDTKRKEPKMTIQTGIDGLRLIAERTKRYAPGPETTFEYDANDRVKKATAHVNKQTLDGQWHTVSASAYYEEYVQTYEGKPSGLWSKPHIMLGKCAEALALRKAFPAEMSGLYTAEEMSQADKPETEYQPPPSVAKATAEVDRKIAALRAVPKGEAAATVAADTSHPATATAVDAVKAVFPGAKEDRTMRISALACGAAPNGLGWTRPHAKNWLRKVFGVDSTGALNEMEQADAEMLLQARLSSEDAYNVALTKLIEEGHVRAEAGE
jgi:phage recombination protein Bet